MSFCQFSFLHVLFKSVTLPCEEQLHLTSFHTARFTQLVTSKSTVSSQMEAKPSTYPRTPARSANPHWRSNEAKTQPLAAY